MPHHPRITLDPDILAGKPVIAGTRLSVEFIIGLLADGWVEADILRNYRASPERTSPPASPMPVICSPPSGSIRARPDLRLLANENFPGDVVAAALAACLA